MGSFYFSHVRLTFLFWVTAKSFECQIVFWAGNLVIYCNLTTKDCSMLTNWMAMENTSLSSLLPTFPMSGNSPSSLSTKMWDWETVGGRDRLSQWAKHTDIRTRRVSLLVSWQQTRLMLESRRSSFDERTNSKAINWNLWKNWSELVIYHMS
jgi:hypothetical protein